MTSEDGGGHATEAARGAPWSRWAVRPIHDRSAFWLLVAAVFVGNGLISARQGGWWLALFQVGTAALAVRAALAVATSRPGWVQPLDHDRKSEQPRQET